ncbi:MAG: UvrABC system protein B [Phycisphaerae bacterium]|nr:UvrABC system protein B [Phycisphaerae bacterium]
MTLILRPYQHEAVQAVYSHLRARDDNPCVVIPTAGGKTPVMATICRDAVRQWGGRVLILAHVKELLEQAVEKLHATAPDLWMQIGVYSAGLRSRDTEHPIIVAGIQSVYRRAAELDRFDLVLIDEAHMIPPDGDGMYQTFLSEAKVVNPNVRLIGLTATPYRMTTGMICGPENLLNHVCYEVGVRELIVQGYLCPLKTKASRRKVDTSGLRVRAGEFLAGEVEALMDDDALVGAACREIVEETQDRKATLIFAAGVKHAEHVQRVLAGIGRECGFVCADTLPFERAATLERFRKGELKYLVNVNVLTTGFDAPNIDSVALLRPTNSPGLYYQMVGRGFRLCGGKADCLVLDFGGNVLRHGPVDAIRIDEKERGNGEAPAKECPQCQALIHAAYSICPECGYEFPPPERQKHEREATSAGILSGQVEDIEYEVQSVSYHVHVKRGDDGTAPKTMRVDYQIGLGDYRSEWVCFEHTGYARQKAEAWWAQRSNEPAPPSAASAVYMANEGFLAETLSITVRHVAGEKFDRIIRHTLGPKPGGVPQPVSVEAGIAEDDIPF